jgi:hypothetical protein
VGNIFEQELVDYCRFSFRRLVVSTFKHLGEFQEAVGFGKLCFESIVDSVSEDCAELGK